MESTRPSPSARHWRISIPVSLGVIMLLASLVIAAVSLGSHTGKSLSPSPVAASIPADDQRWMSLGYVDIEGSVTPLYPLQQGRVKSIEAVENEPVKANQPLFHLDDTVQALKVHQAQIGIRDAKEQLAIAEAKAKQLEQQIAAQKQAVAAAGIEVKRARNLRDKQKSLGEDITDSTEVKNAELLVQKADAGVRAEEKKLAALEAGKPEAEASIRRARLDIEYRESRLQEAQDAVNECVVRAPSDGTPLRILVSVGQALGANPHQPAVQFAAARPLLVRAEVEQEFVGRVRKDQPVVIQDHVTGQECARGKVLSIARWYANRRSASAELLPVGNEVRTLECIIRIESTSQEVRIGQRVRVQFPE
jgi:multidrug resistance efflux pump